MKIIICGAGQVGGQIARHLAREEIANQVTVIDKDASLVRRLTDAYDVSGIAGFASHPDVLERAGARDAVRWRASVAPVENPSTATGPPWTARVRPSNASVAAADQSSQRDAGIDGPGPSCPGSVSAAPARPARRRASTASPNS